MYQSPRWGAIGYDMKKIYIEKISIPAMGGNRIDKDGVIVIGHINPRNGGQ